MTIVLRSNQVKQLVIISEGSSGGWQGEAVLSQCP